MCRVSRVRLAAVLVPRDVPAPVNCRPGSPVPAGPGTEVLGRRSPGPAPVIVETSSVPAARRRGSESSLHVQAACFGWGGFAPSAASVRAAPCAIRSRSFSSANVPVASGRRPRVRRRRELGVCIGSLPRAAGRRSPARAGLQLLLQRFVLRPGGHGASGPCADQVQDDCDLRDLVRVSRDVGPGHWYPDHVDHGGERHGPLVAVRPRSSQCPAVHGERARDIVSVLPDFLDHPSFGPESRIPDAGLREDRTNGRGTGTRQRGTNRFHRAPGRLKIPSGGSVMWSAVSRKFCAPVTDTAVEAARMDTASYAHPTRVHGIRYSLENDASSRRTSSVASSSLRFDAETGPWSGSTWTTFRPGWLFLLGLEPSGREAVLSGRCSHQWKRVHGETSPLRSVASEQSHPPPTIQLSVRPDQNDSTARFPGRDCRVPEAGWSDGPVTAGSAGDPDRPAGDGRSRAGEGPDVHRPERRGAPVANGRSRSVPTVRAANGQPASGDRESGHPSGPEGVPEAGGASPRTLRQREGPVLRPRPGPEDRLPRCPAPGRRRSCPGDQALRGPQSRRDRTVFTLT